MLKRMLRKAFGPKQLDDGPQQPSSARQADEVAPVAAVEPPRAHRELQPQAPVPAPQGARVPVARGAQQLANYRLGRAARSVHERPPGRRSALASLRVAGVAFCAAPGLSREVVPRSATVGLAQATLLSRLAWRRGRASSPKRSMRCRLRRSGRRPSRRENASTPLGCSRRRAQCRALQPLPWPACVGSRRTQSLPCRTSCCCPRAPRWTTPRHPQPAASSRSIAAGGGGAAS